MGKRAKFGSFVSSVCFQSTGIPGGGPKKVAKLARNTAGTREKRRGSEGVWLAWPIDQHWRFLRYPYVIVGPAENMPWHREPSLGPVHS